ncbi:MAG: SDR family NAD(P)-dependent oxidoreductase, partial [Holosporales bacterium]|nr:SDR family NAD(P)-dependent oxidoreductase [Holosporales bacterium]
MCKLMFSLSGYRVLITGGSGSIGRAIAIAMASNGAEVVISGTREAALKKVTDEIRELTGKRALFLQCDLTVSDKAKELIKKFENELGSIDVLVNNAGINRDSLFS